MQLTSGSVNNRTVAPHNGRQTNTPISLFFLTRSMTPSLLLFPSSLCGSFLRLPPSLPPLSRVIEREACLSFILLKAASLLLSSFSVGVSDSAAQKPRVRSAAAPSKSNGGSSRSSAIFVPLSIIISDGWTANRAQPPSAPSSYSDPSDPGGNKSNDGNSPDIVACNAVSQSVSQSAYVCIS